MLDLEGFNTYCESLQKKPSGKKSTINQHWLYFVHLKQTKVCFTCFLTTYQQYPDNLKHHSYFPYTIDEFSKQPQPKYTPLVVPYIKGFYQSRSKTKSSKIPNCDDDSDLQQMEKKSGKANSSEETEEESQDVTNLQQNEDEEDLNNNKDEDEAEEE